MKELPIVTDLISESDLYKATKEIFGFDVVSGLPCGELKHFIAEGSNDQEILHISATNERESVGIAQGAWLAGKTPALYMQNSGLFESSNDLGSLLIPCKTPALFVVSWRGAPGENATQHLYTGAATIPLLEAFGLPYTAEPSESNLLKVKKEMESKGLPGVILVKKERFNDTSYMQSAYPAEKREPAIISNEGKGIELAREIALDNILESLNNNDAVVSSTGLISRSVFQNHDADNQFYNAGAFGLTSAIGLGFAINKPNIRTVAIEGDGSVLTNLGLLNTVAHASPPNFLHIILDNKVYASCSGEKTFGSDVIPLVARDFGYKNITVVQTAIGLKTAINQSGDGPTLIDVQINTVGDRNFKRPLDMDKVAARFREKFSKI